MITIPEYIPDSLKEKLTQLQNKNPLSIDEKALLWENITQKIKLPSDFSVACEIYKTIFQNELINIAWSPNEETINKSNLLKLMQANQIKNYQALHQWSIQEKEKFWEQTLQLLNISLHKPYKKILDLSKGAENPDWLCGASMNITDSCFKADKNKIAIIQGSEETETKKEITYQDLESLVNNVASGLINNGYQPGDKIVIYMPLTIESIAIYLGIIKCGMVVVSVPDSFSSPELQKRIELSQAKLIFTCDNYYYGGKSIEVYSKVKSCNSIRSVVYSDNTNFNSISLQQGDYFFQNFISTKPANTFYSSPDSLTNILFSSGTTKEPKAIPWTHLTPIKCAGDAFYHQDVKPDDIITWTTGMGWMMAPWLIYAALINQATMAIYHGAATGEGFGKFAEEVKISIMGTIPSVVKIWKRQNFLDKYHWSVRLFSSTGEPSNEEDYFYLMALSQFKAPVIEYCGGTEIGGGYITGTILQPASPSCFTTPALGINFLLLNDQLKVVEDGDPGEVFLIPPSIGLTQTLLNKNHHEEYYKDVPPGPNGEVLRKHGDGFTKYNVMGTSFYKSIGRVDDAMNLGGIKVSAVEIEEIINTHPSIEESAAISIPDKNSGPEKLIVFCKTSDTIDPPSLLNQLKKMVAEKLNPLFKVSEVVLIDKIPRTASNKIMRRELRKQFIEKNI